MLQPLRTCALRCDLCGDMLVGNLWPYLRQSETKLQLDWGSRG